MPKRRGRMGGGSVYKKGNCYVIKFALGNGKRKTEYGGWTTKAAAQTAGADIAQTPVITWCREGELNPQGAKHRRILSTLKGSEPLGKFSTLLYFSTSYKIVDSHRSDPIRFVVSKELLQFK